MSILIGGGTGFVGQNLARVFKASGYNVKIISRTANAANNTISWEEVKKTGLPECKAVINLSGRNVGEVNPLFMLSGSKFDDFKKELYTSRIDTTKLLAQAIQKMDKPPSVFIGSSAIGFYEPKNDAEYTEESKRGDFWMSRLCEDWEKALELPEKPEVRTVCLRTGLVLAREGGLLGKLQLPFFFGLGGPMGSGEQWMPWIHMEDLVALFKFVVENENVNGSLNACVPEPCRQREFMRALGAAMRRPSSLPMPEFAVRALFGADRAPIMLLCGKVLPKRTLDYGFEFKHTNIEKALKTLY